MHAWARKQTGFTIVELLIVVVVIAILAAITIVAFNGVQDRAKASATQSAASQIGKKVLAYAPQNNDTFPTESSFRSALNLPVSDAPSLVYTYMTTDNQKAFCISASNTSKSPVLSYAFTERGQVVSGICAKNYVVNPGAEGATPITSSTGAPVIELSNDTAAGWPKSGSRSFKISATTTSETRVRSQSNAIPVLADSTVQVSIYVRNASSAARQFAISFQGRSSTGTIVASSALPAVTIGPGSSMRLAGSLDSSIIATTYAGAAYIEPMIARTSGAATDIFYVDDFYGGYAPASVDYTGALDGWSWTGAQFDSASFGPLVITN